MSGLKAVLCGEIVVWLLLMVHFNITL